MTFPDLERSLERSPFSAAPRNSMGGLCLLCKL
jgi:hypothetical protein